MLDSRCGLTRAEGHNHSPRPAGHACLDPARDMVDLLGCECTLLGHIELLVNQHPQVLLLMAALKATCYQGRVESNSIHKTSDPLF